MSLLPNAFVNVAQPTYVKYYEGGGGGGGSNVSTLSVSTLTTDQIDFGLGFVLNDNISLLSTLGVKEAVVGSGGLTMDGQINMENNIISLSAGGASIYEDAGTNVTYLLAETGSLVSIGTQSNFGSLTVSDDLVYAFKPFSASTIIGVSTINGAQYPPQGSGTVSTLGFSIGFPGGVGTIPSGGTPTAMTTSFTVDPTHRYRVSFEAGYATTDANCYITTYVSGTSPTHYLETVYGAAAVAGSNDARASSSGVFVPSAGSAQIVVQNSSAATAASLTANASAGVVLEDLGAV